MPGAGEGRLWRAASDGAQRELSAARNQMYDYIMLRTQISLTAADRKLLDRESARTGRSIARLIRDAVERTYGGDRDEDADLRALDDAFGAWGSGATDGEAYVEQLRSGGRLSRAIKP